MEVNSTPMIWITNGQTIGDVSLSMMGFGGQQCCSMQICAVPGTGKARASLWSIWSERGRDGPAPELYSCQKANSGSSNPASPAGKLVPRWSLPMMTSTCKRVYTSWKCFQLSTAAGGVTRCQAGAQATAPHGDIHPQGPQHWVSTRTANEFLCGRCQGRCQTLCSATPSSLA